MICNMKTARLSPWGCHGLPTTATPGAAHLTHQAPVTSTGQPHIHEQSPVLSPVPTLQPLVISSQTCSLDEDEAQVAVTFSGAENEGKDKDRGVRLILKPQVPQSS